MRFHCGRATHALARGPEVGHAAELGDAAAELNGAFLQARRAAVGLAVVRTAAREKEIGGRVRG